MSDTVQTGQLKEAVNTLKFILAGNAIFTLRNTESGERHTYKVTEATKRNPNDPSCHFVALLNGPDNTRDYAYIGFIKKEGFIWGGQKARAGKSAPSVVDFIAAFESFKRGSLGIFEVYHEGRCGRCARPLTVPESIEAGFGPECIHLVNAGFAATLPGIDPIRKTDSYKVSHTVAPDTSHLETVFQDGKFVGKGESLSAVRDRINGREAAAALYAPAQPVAVIIDDAAVKVLVEEYKLNHKDDYYQDGMLDEEQAAKVAWNKFRRQLEKAAQGVR
jgi:cation transport regulator ChaB